MSGVQSIGSIAAAEPIEPASPCPPESAEHAERSELETVLVGVKSHVGPKSLISQSTIARLSFLILMNW